MKLKRTQNTVRNAAYAYFVRFILMFFPFITRSIFIQVLGAEYLGLDGLFTSILSVLNLSELGFGSAIVVHMYRAIAEDNHDGINALLNYYKKVYHIVGVVILAAGCTLIPFLPKLIQGTYPEGINLTVVYLVYLFDTCISYFLFAYYVSLLSAFQRDDLLAKARLLVKLLIYAIQIGILLTVHNYYIYLVTLPVFTIVRNVVVYFFARKAFPEYKPRGIIPEKVKRDIGVKARGAMIGKVAFAFRNAFDSIFISMFVGLTATAIYGNYYYILNTVAYLLLILPDAASGGGGNSVALETQEKNYQDMNRMNFLYMWLSGWCAVCLLCLYQPFMALWVGEDMLLPNSTMVLFCVYFYLLKTGDVLSIYSGAKGLFWEKRFIRIAEIIGNISLNYFLGKFFGISGILWATIITVAGIELLFGSRVPFKYYFTDYSANQYLLKHLKYACVTTFVAAVTYWISRLVIIQGIGGLISIGMICVVIPNVLFFLIYHRTGIYQNTIPWIFEKIKMLIPKHI